LLDAPTRAALAARVDRLREVAPGVAWVAPDNLHVTLKFLGGVDAPRLDRVRAALDRAVAGVPAFDLAVHGLGAFPTPTRARVVWAGIGDGGEALRAVAGRVERELAVLGFPPEERPFSPHVTLGRVREPRRNERLAAALARETSRSGTVRVDRVSLMRSDLSPRGARYSELSGHLLV
jgi:2'-5' RNA ligase